MRVNRYQLCYECNSPKHYNLDLQHVTGPGIKPGSSWASAQPCSACAGDTALSGDTLNASPISPAAAQASLELFLGSQLGVWHLRPPCLSLSPPVILCPLPAAHWGAPTATVTRAVTRAGASGSLKLLLSSVWVGWIGFIIQSSGCSWEVMLILPQWGLHGRDSFSLLQGSSAEQAPETWYLPGTIGNYAFRTQMKIWSLPRRQKTELCFVFFFYFIAFLSPRGHGWCILITCGCGRTECTSLNSGTFILQLKYKVTASAFCFGEGLVGCQSTFVQNFCFLNEGKGGLYVKGATFYVSPKLK